MAETTATYTSMLKYDIRAMLRKFGVVTVMDVKAYKTELHAVDQEAVKGVEGIGVQAAYSAGEWDAVSTFAAKPVFTLDTLKIANINQEGPTKTITGGQTADTLLKYGKTVSMEMQDALGRYDVLENIYGVNFADNHQIASFTDRFPGELTLVGTTFVIDQKTGAKQPVHIVIPRFLGDGIFNLTQDAEGDATVFDLNGNVIKFEGGAAGTDAVETKETRFDDKHESKIDGKIYGEGVDNEFYFMCTKEVLPVIETLGYREAYAGWDFSEANGEGRESIQIVEKK
jgi:hypothetical protein